MNLTINLPDDQAAALKAAAQSQGESPDRIISRALESVLTASKNAPCGPPFETGYGMWAKYGPAPSTEEIDENRREMFRNFPKDL